MAPGEILEHKGNPAKREAKQDVGDSGRLLRAYCDDEGITRK
jgi:hypothetical protein